MDLEARLRAFAALARRSSFSRAADELGISQPAVSKHVADLEAALGTPLVIREPRGARLTAAGELLASYVERAESLLALAERGLESLANAESGRLALAASSTPGVYLLPRALATFSVGRPQVEVDVTLTNSAGVVELVRMHRAELGIVGGLATAPELVAEPLLEDEIVVIGSAAMADRALSPGQLGDLTWISREEGSATQAAIENAWENLGVRPRRIIRMPNWEMIKIAVAEGAGVGAISRLGIDLERRTRRLAILDVAGWHVVRALSVVHSRDVPLSPLPQQFLVALRRSVADRRPRRS